MDKLFGMLFPNGNFSLSMLIFSIIFVFIALKAFYDAIIWIKERLDHYHKMKSEKETTEKRIEKIEEENCQQFNKLEELSNMTKEAINLLEEVRKQQQNSIVETNKGIIFRIYLENMKQGHISQTELDRFISVCQIYKEAGGDGIVDEKIYPEVLKLPIENEKGAES